jgi:hypothetical protein
MSEETFEAYPGGPCVTRVDFPDLTPQDFGLQVDADGRIVNEHFPPTGSPPMPPTSLGGRKKYITFTEQSQNVVSVVFENGKNLGELLRDVDGDFYYLPQLGGGTWPAHAMQEIVDELNRRNAMNPIHLHAPTSLFADMLSLLKKHEWTEEASLIVRDGDQIYSRACPECEEYEYDGHAPGCHLQSTIALAEEHLNEH